MKTAQQEKLLVIIPAFIYTPIALMLLLTLFTVGSAA